MIYFEEEKSLWLKNFDNLQVFLEEVTLRSLSAPCKQGIPNFLEGELFSCDKWSMKNAAKDMCNVMPIKVHVGMNWIQVGLWWFINLVENDGNYL